MKKLKKSKILIIGSVPPPVHGSNIYIRELLSSKIRNNFIVKHLDTSDPRNDLNNLGKFDLQNILVGLKNIFQLFACCMKYKPGILYICPSQGNAYWRDGLFIITFKMFFTTKVIQHLHGSDFHNFYLGSNWIFRIFIDMTQKKVDRTIVLGRSLKRIFFRWHNEQTIDVVPNGIDLNINLDVKLNKSGLPVLYFLGNLLKFKGIHIAVQALTLIKNKFPQIQMKIAGNWAYDSVFNESESKIKGDIEQIVEKEQLQVNIQFLGQVYDKRKTDLLVTSDILVYPSINDGLPLVILESMAAGNVVIAIKDVGAISDVVLHNETGILINQQDPEEVAEAIEYLIRNPEERIRMSFNAHSYYRKYYTKEIHINKMIEVFNKALSDNE